MAYIKFSITTIETDLKDQSIYINFNKEYDSDTVSHESILIALKNESRNNALLYDYDIIFSDDLKTVQLKFKSSPEVNSEYVLIIQNTILDLEGKALDKSLFRSIVFKSTVTSDIKLLSPTNFEIIKDKTFKWKEVGEKKFNFYRLQVSTDTNFYNILVDVTISDKNEITLGQQIVPGQYFYRIRAEESENYGRWSETRTFLINQTEEIPEEVAPTEKPSTSENNDDISEENPHTDDPITLHDDETGIIIEDLVNEEQKLPINIIDQPKNGETPASFSFMFDQNIDPNSIKVSVIRSDF